MTIRSDNPIKRPEDDVLGRARLARSFATQIRQFDVSQGLVVGVLGPWGSGKTSFVNMTRLELEKTGVPILDFNPWMFSGAEQLVDSFFVEIASQLKLKPGFAGIGTDLEDYGETFSGLGWLPLVGPWIERGRGATKLLAKILQRRKEGVSGRREKLEKALGVLDKPIVVVLDDIDRLTTAEIRDVFKLVRLTANFPNVIYLVAFDRARVEDALAEQGIPGRDYLEKILQIGIDLPVVPQQMVDGQIFRSIDAALESIDNFGPFNSDLWPDVFVEVIRPLVRNMRDVRRFAVAVHGTVTDLEGQIEIVDVLALEAIRVFLPDVFQTLSGSVDGLTTTSAIGFGGSQEPAHLKSRVDKLIKSAGDRTDVVTALIQRLFPAAARHVGGSHYGGEWRKTWLSERRVAHQDLLRLYLERVVGESLQAFTDAEKAWARMTDRRAFDEFLRGIEVERRQDVISSLEEFEDRFAAEHVVPGAIVLLNLLPELPKRQRGMFDPDTGLVVGRVIYRLLRSLGDEHQVESAVTNILPELSALGSKLELIMDVGHREGRGHKLASEQGASQFEREWRNEVRSASVEQLLREQDLLRVLIAVKRDSEDSEAAMIVPDLPEVTRSLLESARTDVRSQSMGNRSVRTSPRLVWDALVEVFPDEATLKTRIDQLKGTAPDGMTELLELADRYASGWRPKNFGDES